MFLKKTPWFNVIVESGLGQVWVLNPGTLPAALSSLEDHTRASHGRRYRTGRLGLCSTGRDQHEEGILKFQTLFFVSYILLKFYLLRENTPNVFYWEFVHYRQQNSIFYKEMVCCSDTEGRARPLKR